MAAGSGEDSFDLEKDSEIGELLEEDDTKNENRLFDEVEPGFLVSCDHKKYHILYSMMRVQTEEGYANGKMAQEDLEGFFGLSFSQGTLYSRLHELEDEGCLEMVETTNTKDYFVTEEGRQKAREYVQNLATFTEGIGGLYADKTEDLERPDAYEHMSRNL